MKALLRFVAWVGRKAQQRLDQIKEREARAKALAPGTLVRLCCPCPYDHSGTWMVDKYLFESNDYRIVRVGDGKHDYATRDVLVVIS